MGWEPYRVQQFDQLRSRLPVSADTVLSPIPASVKIGFLKGQVRWVTASSAEAGFYWSMSHVKIPKFPWWAIEVHRHGKPVRRDVDAIKTHAAIIARSSTAAGWEDVTDTTPVRDRYKLAVKIADLLDRGALTQSGITFLGCLNTFLGPSLPVQ